MKNSQALIVSLNEAEKVEFLKAAINGLQGKMFGAVNVKKDLTKRDWKGVRTGVSKYTNGTGRAKPLPYHQVGVFEPNNNNQYRTIDLRTVVEFRANGQQIKFA